MRHLAHRLRRPSASPLVALWLVWPIPLVGSAEAPLDVANSGFEVTDGGPTYQEVLVDDQWTQPSVEDPQPRDWLTRVYAGSVRSALDPRVRHGGNYSLTLQPLSRDPAASANIYQQFAHNLEEGRDYTVTFWVRKTPLAKAGISVWSDGGAHFESQANWDFQADLTRWQKIEFCFSARRTTTQGFWIMLSMHGAAGEQVWFDDVSCRAGRPGDDELRAPTSPQRVPPAAKARGYAFFDPVGLGPITPASQPRRLSSSARLTIDACPGEFAAGSVGIYAVRDLENLRVDSGELVDPEGTIDADEVDVQVVKCWRQRRSLWTTQPPPYVVMPDYLVPELLLKDDRWDDANRPQGFNAEVRLTGPVVTDLPAGTCKQLWVTVHVPEAVPPGLYQGSLTLDEANEPASTVDVILNVLPFQLADTPEILGAYVNTGYGFGRDRAAYSDSRYERKLQDLRDHGLNSVSILDGVGREQVDGEWALRWDDLRRALERREQYGLDRFSMFEGFVWDTEETVPLYRGGSSPEAEASLRWYVRALNEAVAEAELAPLTYYLNDEPHSHPNGISDARRLGQLVHEAGGQTCTAVTATAYEEIGPAIDIPILGIGLDTRRYLRAVRDGRASPSEHPLLCYWQFWEEHPLLNRYVFGYFLWASGLDGAIPYGYQHFGGSGDPWDDFDTSGKDIFAAYPSREGPVATLQWEACREGISDLRYLRTLEDAVRRARARLAASPRRGRREAQRDVKRAEEFLSDLRGRIQIIPSVPVRLPPDAHEHRALRKSVISHILALGTES